MLTYKPPEQENLDEFWTFVAERQAVWHRRVVLGKPKPWTEDLVIRNTKFTNIYRELDPGTKFIVEEVLEQVVDDNKAVFNTLLYRLIGRDATLRRLGIQDPHNFDVAGFTKALRTIRDDPDAPPVYTGAYIVAAYSHMGGADKAENIAKLFGLICKRWDAFMTQLRACKTSEQAFQAIEGLPGFGRFLAYQVLVDLRYPLKSWGGCGILPFDNDSWVIAGPGAQKGLGMLGVTSQVYQLPAMRWLRENQQQEFERLGIEFHKWDGKDLDLSNIQGCLCEYHKYHKIKNGTGHGRSSYPGERDHAQTAAAEEFF